MRAYLILFIVLACFSTSLSAGDTLSESDWQEAVGNKEYTESYKEIERKERNEPKETHDLKFNNLPLVKTIIIVIIALVLIALLVALIMSLLKINTTHKISNKFLVEEVDDPDQFRLSDLEKYLKEALSAGNFRLAVRIHFLMLIKALNENDFIGWKKEKTNWDYLQEVKEFGFYNDFKYVIKVFEKVWYANYNIEQNTYDQVAVKFVEIPQKLQSER